MVVVDHQPVFLEALAVTLDMAPGIAVVGRGRSARDVGPHLDGTTRVAVVGVDSGAGAAPLRELRAMAPALRLVALAACADLSVTADARRAGACGLLLRSQPPPELVEAVREAALGGTRWPPGALTERELEVLGCLAHGLSRSAIAGRLVVSPHTVRTHITNVLRKLDVHSSVAAVAAARRAGWSAGGVSEVAASDPGPSPRR